MLRHILRAAVLAVMLSLPATPVWAGFDEGLAAFNRGDYATALREFRPLAHRGNAAAQHNLGLMYTKGQGVPQDNARAVKWYRKAANQGLARAQHNLGIMYDNGLGVQLDDAEAVKWYRKSANQGVADSQHNLGAMYANGDGVPRDYSEAVKWYRRAANQGLVNSQHNLGIVYAKGEGVPRDFVRAHIWLTLAVAQGYEEAIKARKIVAKSMTASQLAEAQKLAKNWRPNQRLDRSDSRRPSPDPKHQKARYEEGMAAGKRGDYAAAAREFRPLANQGDARAQHALGIMYRSGKGVPQDYDRAVMWLRKAANQGYAKAQNSLGFMYRRGRGVPRDNFEASKWYRKAANQGLARAQFNLGVLYRDGEGVTQNYAEAVKWFKKAATQDYTKAQSSLGKIYRDGEGVTQDRAEAMKWFKKAANKGYANSQFSLGIMYGKGEGVPQDYFRAYIWFSLAAAQGHKEAAKGRGIVAKGLSNYQLAEAQKLAKNWRPNQKTDQLNPRKPSPGRKRPLAGYDEALAAYKRGDYATALRVLRPLANQGHAKSQYSLGLMYRRGRGVPQDDAEAVKWYRKAANQGHASAQYNLGVLYRDGEGVTQDDTKAVTWYRKAANQDHAKAQYSVGIMYAKGEGVPRSYVRAHIWFSLAAAQGHEKAAKGREIVAQGLSRFQLAEAQKLAKNWRPHQNSDQPIPIRPSPGRKRQLEATGSGFFITLDGHVLTNHHVINGCSEIRIKSQTVDVMAVDKGSDLALLKGAKRRGGYATFRGRRGVRLGEDVIVAGYPLQGLLTSNINITKGTVSAMAGPGDDRRLIQITAPVQPGNSGGPVIDQSGHVVGVVVSKLSALSLFSKIGSLPQNVNFAVSEGTVRAFLDAENVNYKTAPSTKSMSTADIAAKAKGFTVLVECLN